MEVSCFTSSEIPTNFLSGYNPSLNIFLPTDSLNTPQFQLWRNVFGEELRENFSHSSLFSISSTSYFILNFVLINKVSYFFCFTFAHTLVVWQVYRLGSRLLGTWTGASSVI